MNKNIEIDWSGFDINNYPKVNPYEILNKTQLFKTTGHDYPLNEIGYMFISIFFGMLSAGGYYVEENLYSVLFGMIAIYVLYIMIWRRNKGLKLYRKICMEQYKSEYIKKIEYENYVNVRQIAILGYAVKGENIYQVDAFAKKEKTNLELVRKKKIYKPRMNQASIWYIEQKNDLGDIILLKKDDFYSENKKATECGLPEEYYVIAEKGTHWLCCHAEEECIYAFSKTLGLTHTKYQSLYDYIIDTCNIPFDVEKDA